LKQKTLFGKQIEVTKATTKSEPNIKTTQSSKLDLDSEKGFETQVDRNKKQYTEEVCLKRLETDLYVWDMRCWDKYKDRDEVIRYLENFDYEKRDWNAGHCKFCINFMINNWDTPLDKIADSIMANPHIQFKNRLVKCWSQPEKCANKYKEQGDYGNGICEECQ